MVFFLPISKSQQAQLILKFLNGCGNPPLHNQNCRPTTANKIEDITFYRIITLSCYGGYEDVKEKLNQLIDQELRRLG